MEPNQGNLVRYYKKNFFKGKKMQLSESLVPPKKEEEDEEEEIKKRRRRNRD